MTIEVMPVEYRHEGTLLEGMALYDTGSEKPKPVVLVQRGKPVTNAAVYCGSITAAGTNGGVCCCSYRIAAI